MKHITVGVAGHIDHGKTSLVKALTGVETDRLKEEQERGMSIVLGFAHLECPAGQIDLIDVPGHEKFIRTMISGATGIEAVLLVVAANEMVKPQTVEHLALIELLGVKQGLVIVTKSDLIEPDLRPLAEEDLRGFLHETCLRDAPILFTSTVTSEGIAELKSALYGLLSRAAELPSQPSYYLPVDRAFTIAGHGTIVTGTLRCGSLRTGQTVEIMPNKGTAEIRALEVHNHMVETAEPGWRVAVNLRGVKKEEIERGDALATPSFLRSTRLLDVELTLLAAAAKPLRRGQIVLLYFGTSEYQARVYPLDRDEILPGDTALAQLRLLEDTAVPVRQPFIVRTYSPMATIGGGTIVDSYPQKHTRTDADVLRRVEALAHGSLSQILLEKLSEAGRLGVDIKRLGLDWSQTPQQTQQELDKLPAIICGETALLLSVFHGLAREAMDIVNRYHAAYKTHLGMPREELRRKLQPNLPSVVFERIIDELIVQEKLDTVEGLVRESGYSPEAMLTPPERQILCEIEESFRVGGLKPPNLKDVLGVDRRRKNLFHLLVRKGVLVSTIDQSSNRTVVFHQEAMIQAERLLEQHLPPGEGRTVSELNTILGTSRKYSVPLLEYLDARGATKRVGDLRGWNRERG